MFESNNYQVTKQLVTKCNSSLWCKVSVNFLRLECVAGEINDLFVHEPTVVEVVEVFFHSNHAAV